MNSLSESIRTKLGPSPEPDENKVVILGRAQRRWAKRAVDRAEAKLRKPISVQTTATRRGTLAGARELFPRLIAELHEAGA